MVQAGMRARTTPPICMCGRRTDPTSAGFRTQAPNQESDMYPKVLVAIDGSPTSDAALVEAITLAKEQGSALRLVHVVDAGPAYLSAETPFQLDEYERALYKSGEI